MRRNPWAIALGILLVTVGFFVGTPYAADHLSQLVHDARMEVEHYRNGHFGFEGSHNGLAALRYFALLGTGIVPLVLSPLGVAIVWKRWGRGAAALLAIAPFIHLVNLGMQRVFFSRNLCLSAPFIALAAGIATAHLWDFRRAEIRGAFRGLVIAGASLAAIQIVTFELLCLHEDTRVESDRWLSVNIPPSSRLLAVGPFPFLPPSLRSRWGVKWVGSRQFLDLDASSLLGFDALVVTYGEYTPVFRESDSEPLRAAHDRLMSELLPFRVRTFSTPLNHVWYMGPFLRGSTLNSFHSPTIVVYAFPSDPPHAP
jgi:hypothetical protein